MSTPRINLSHEERTATEPRDASLHRVNVARIETVNATIRVFKLRIQDHERGVKFLPGQWLDVFIPGLPKAGGFTLTSTPALATAEATGSATDRSDLRPYLELAIQRSPEAPAAWFWRPENEILDAELTVRVGGSFVWPPPRRCTSLKAEEIEKVVFVAGGVGINPLISMISHMHDDARTLPPPAVQLLYATKAADGAGKILFLDRLLDVAAASSSSSTSPFRLKLFLTGSAEAEQLRKRAGLADAAPRRIAREDVLAALGEGEGSSRAKTVCYVCGPPAMTDEYVELLQQQPGMQAGRVFCEKWW